MSMDISSVNTRRAFKPGFRLSFLDALVLAVGAMATAGLARIDPALAAALAFVVGHFFVFCNVVRMARPLELVWAGQFMLSSSSTVLMGTPTWPQTFLLALACTATLTALQLRKPSYHGVFWQRLNPSLPAWWQRHGGQGGETHQAQPPVGRA